jgi:metacaspase-1
MRNLAPSRYLTEAIMKKTYLFLFVFLFLTVLQVTAQAKRALIVAIGDYDISKTRWKPINVEIDVILLEEALRKQKFPRENITVLKNEEATKVAIENALDKLAKDCGPGDIVVVHFSSHGQQLEDDGNDEMDLLDEAIVPYDAIYRSNPVEFVKYAAGYIRDDKFGEKVTAIRNQIGSGGDLLVLLDACHSGTGTRGAGTAVVRGGDGPMVSDKFETRKKTAKVDAAVFKEDTKLQLKENASSYVVLSGSRAHERNWETVDENRKPVGSLSYAFTKALSTLDSNMSYRGLFASIENIMREKSPKQKPVLEGDGLDRKLFGGEYVRQKNYFTILPAQSNKDTITINAGEVSGLTTGSVVAFYPAGTIDPAGKESLQKGTVVASTYFTAIVKLDKPDTSLAKQEPWVFVTELFYGNKKIKLKVNDAIPGASAKAETAFNNFQLIEIGKEGELYLDTLGTADKWIYKYVNSGIPFGEETFSITDSAKMKEIIKRYDRFQYLRDLKFSEQGLSANVELVFLDAAGNIDTAKLASRRTLTGLEFKEGDEVYLKIVNTGDKRFFINIVDIQPDGIINPILPNKRLKDKNKNPAPIRAEDCMVDKGDSLLLKTLRITVYPPHGEETFKVFLSGEKLDLEDILTDNNDRNSRSPGGILNNMAKVFKGSKVNDKGSRGDGPTINTNQNGTIFSIGFSIVPNK